MRHPRCNARSTTASAPRRRLTPAPALRQARGPMRFPSPLQPLPCALALVFLAACAASAPPPAAAPAGAVPSAAASNATPPPPPPGDDGRLPATVTPQR